MTSTQESTKEPIPALYVKCEEFQKILLDLTAPKTFIHPDYKKCMEKFVPYVRKKEGSLVLGNEQKKLSIMKLSNFHQKTLDKKQKFLDGKQKQNDLSDDDFKSKHLNDTEKQQDYYYTGKSYLYNEGKTVVCKVILHGTKNNTTLQYYVGTIEHQISPCNYDTPQYIGCFELPPYELKGLITNGKDPNMKLMEIYNPLIEHLLAFTVFQKDQVVNPYKTKIEEAIKGIDTAIKGIDTAIKGIDEAIKDSVFSLTFTVDNTGPITSSDRNYLKNNFVMYEGLTIKDKVINIAFRTEEKEGLKQNPPVVAYPVYVDVFAENENEINQNEINQNEINQNEINLAKKNERATAPYGKIIKNN